MRTFIAGGHGFLGGRLGVYLSDKGHQVLLGSRRKLEIPNWLPNAINVVTDYTSEYTLQKNFEGIDLIIHASGLNSKECEINPEKASRVNGLETAYLINAAVKQGVSNFIYLSTAHVYSNPLEGKIDENTPTSSKHPYATSHLAGEAAVIAASEKFKINVLVIRLSNAYGSPVTPSINCWNLFINQVCKEIIEHKKISLNSSGEQKRNFISIYEFSQIIFNLSNLMHEQNLPKIINVGSKESISVYGMAQYIQSRSKFILGYEPYIKKIDRLNQSPTRDLQYNSLYFNLYENFLTKDNNDEIDNLLTSCAKWFQR